MKQITSYSNLHDGGRIDDNQFVCVMVPPADAQTLRTRTWLLSLTPDKLLKRTTHRPKR